jgi:ATP-dependent DNA helicase RecG
MESRIEAFAAAQMNEGGGSPRQRRAGRKLHPGARGIIQGQAKLRGKYLELANPKWEPEGPVEAAPRSERLRPIYPASEELLSSQIERAVTAVLAPLMPSVEDPLPAEYRASRALPPLSECYRRMHAPASVDEQREARRRLAFEELLLLQLGVMMKKRQMREGARAPTIRSMPRKRLPRLVLS